MGKKMKKYGHINFMLFFPLLFLYYEVIYRVGVANSSIFDISFIYLLLFSFAYGGIAYLLASIAKKPKVNKIITACFIGVSGVIYLAEYLVRKFFKMPYDIETVFNGAGGVVTHYAGETFTLILTSIPIILLYVAPFVLYLIFGKKYLPAFGSNAYVRIIAGAVSIITFVLSVLLVSAHSVNSLCYDEEYSFEKAVDSFGLATGLRLDIKYLISEKEVSFSSDGNVLPQLNNGEDANQTIEYGKNELDLNFEELNKGASSSIKKLNDYVSSLQASSKNQYTGIFKGKNLIMITAEAFTAEVIDPVLTPTLYRLATKGIQFTDFYQPASAGTTGGEYQNIFGMLPMQSGSSFKGTVDNLNWYTMGSQLNRLGYYGKAFHNNSYTYYGRNVTHTKIGYSDGFMGLGNGMEKYVKNAWPQSDLEMFQGTLPTYINKQPFNVYYMSVSGHNGYTQSGNSMTKKNWERVKHLNYSNDVKGYLAANLELEDALAYTVSQLEAAGIANDTVIVICTDHFPYGLDNDAQLGYMDNLSELYGYKVTNYFQRDHNRLIIWSGSLESSEPIVVDSPTFSLDLLPTLSNLFGTEFDSRLMPGRDALSDAPALVYNTNYDWKTDFGTYYASSGKFKPNDGVECPEGFENWDAYVKYMKEVVQNKIKFSTEAPKRDYYRHIFG